MHGDTRKACMINNTLYQEGEQVDSFTIEKISPELGDREERARTGSS